MIFSDIEAGKSILSGIQRIQGNEISNMLEEVFNKKKGNVVQFPTLTVKDL